MRVAVWHNLPSGGAKRALHDHIKDLVRQGHHVEAWCPPTADQSYLPLSGLVREHVVDLAWPVPFRHSDEWQITLDVERRLAVMEAHCRECATAIDRGGFDILFANTCMFFATSPIGRHARIPSALYLQEPFRELYEAVPTLCWQAPPAGRFTWRRPATLRSAFASWRQLRNWRVQAREEARNAAGFDKLLVNSYFSRESILRTYGLGADVCYLGIDGRTFPFLDLPREPMVVGLGSINASKGVALAIEALAQVSLPRPKLVWIGNGADTAFLAQMAELARSRSVKAEFRVRVSDSELLDTLNRAMAMIYAPRLEPFGLAPLEANACGVPVIAVAEGGVRETIQDGVNGLLVDQRPAAIAAAVERLRDDPALARRLGDGGRDAVRDKWSDTAATDRIERALASTRKGPARSQVSSDRPGSFYPSFG